MYRTDRRPSKKWLRVSLAATSKMYFLMLKLRQASTQVSNVRARAYVAGGLEREPAAANPARVSIDICLLLLLITSKSAILACLDSGLLALDPTNA